MFNFFLQAHCYVIPLYALLLKVKVVQLGCNMTLAEKNVLLREGKSFGVSDFFFTGASNIKIKAVAKPGKL